MPWLVRYNIAVERAISVTEMIRATMLMIVEGRGVMVAICSG
jgi:hypothetical protein